MDYHINIHISMLLTSIATISLLLLTTLPPSLSQQPLFTYSLCNQQPYECGALSDIPYPFWGHSRSPYCGGGYQFELTCEPEQKTYIQMGSTKLEVQEINTTAYTLKMVPLEQPEVCSPQFNFSLSPLFWYPNTVHNFTIFYDCPSGVSNDGNKFTCPDSGSSSVSGSGYEGGKDEVLKQYPELKKCGRSIQVPAEFPAESNGVDFVDALNAAFGQGFHVNYVVSKECLTCLRSKGACGTNDIVKHQFNCYCQAGSNALECSVRRRLLESNRSHWGKKVIKGFLKGFISAVILGLLLVCITIGCLRRKSSRWQEIFWLPTKSNQDIEAFLKNIEALTLKRYKFSDVKKMTNSFKVKLGHGGFGTVYKGKLHNGCPVAIKVLNSSKENDEEFINEVASISRTSHVNIVTLLGFCLEGRKKALIYEFMSNGSLERFINRKEPETTPSLSWDNLYQIAIGIARGLEYLHRGCNTRILHFDIKPHNILLDENFCPKISDFGLAKLCPKKESIISMSVARGTIGYVAPEVWNRHFGGVSHKSDVYSYGMMLLDIIGGRNNINAEASHTSEVYFPDWVYKKLDQGTHLGVDGETAIQQNEIIKRITMVGLWCIQTIPNDRPTMSRALDMLEGSMNSLEMPPKPILSSPISLMAESSTTMN